LRFTDKGKGLISGTFCYKFDGGMEKVAVEEENFKLQEEIEGAYQRAMKSLDKALIKGIDEQKEKPNREARERRRTRTRNSVTTTIELSFYTGNLTTGATQRSFIYSGANRIFLFVLPPLRFSELLPSVCYTALQVGIFPADVLPYVGTSYLSRP